MYTYIYIYTHIYIYTYIHMCVYMYIWYFYAYVYIHLTSEGLEKRAAKWPKVPDGLVAVGDVAPLSRGGP